MFGLNTLETILSGAMVAVLVLSGCALSLITERRIKVANARRRYRTAQRAAERRDSGVTVRPPEYRPSDVPGPPGRHGRPTG